MLEYNVRGEGLEGRVQLDKRRVRSVQIPQNYGCSLSTPVNDVHRVRGL